MTGPANNFRASMRLAEQKRADVLARLERLPEPLHAQPGYKNVRKLLSGQFAKATVAQRLVLLQSAEWLLKILESMPF